MLHDLLFGLRERRDVSLVIVTHSRDLASRADRIMVLEGGRLEPAASV
jgi:predicted ABC-type transport system involved in lysophospholipase L1 biosynthesis ATPase subunit